MFANRNVRRRELFALVLTGALVATGFGLANAATPSHSSPPPARAGSASISCKGTPIKLMTIFNTTPGATTYLPAGKYGSKAAASAVNKTCEDGRPIQVINCNDNGTAAGDASCGQQAVSDHVLAVVGAE